MYGVSTARVIKTIKSEKREIKERKKKVGVDFIHRQLYRECNIIYIGLYFVTSKALNIIIIIII